MTSDSTGAAERPLLPERYIETASDTWVDIYNDLEGHPEETIDHMSGQQLIWQAVPELTEAQLETIAQHVDRAIELIGIDWNAWHEAGEVGLPFPRYIGRMSLIQLLSQVDRRMPRGPGW